MLLEWLLALEKVVGERTRNSNVLRSALIPTGLSELLLATVELADHFLSTLETTAAVTVASNLCVRFRHLLASFLRLFSKHSSDFKASHYSYSSLVNACTHAKNGPLVFSLLPYRKFRIFNRNRNLNEA